MNELREIIQEAWNKGEKGADTFGAFLDRAANAISEAGYRKVKPPIKVNHCQLKQTACPCPTGGETSGGVDSDPSPSKSCLERRRRFAILREAFKSE